MTQTISQEINLLIIEENARQRATLTRAFKKNYRVASVGSRDAALGVLRRLPVTVVLLSAALPWREVLQAIRANWPTLPVILISESNDDIREGLKMGANDYLTDPFDDALAQARIEAQAAMQQKLAAQEKTINDLRQIQEQQQHILRMMAHDLRHPVTNLRMAELILRRNITAPDTEIIMDGVASSLDTMQEVLEDFSNALAMGEDINGVREPLLLDDVLYKVIAQYAPAAMRKDIAITNGDLSGSVTANQRQLVQIIGNLISNAIKYSPSQSTIRIWTTHDDDVIRICVGDQGAGIPKSERDQVFTEFGKLSNRPTGQESSTGLGLWIVKNLTEAMEGRVGFECPASGGSIFWVELPIAETRVNPQAHSAITQPVRKSTRRQEEATQPARPRLQFVG